MSETTAYQLLLECLLCREEFDREGSLRAHLRSDHPRADLVDFVVRAVEERDEVGGRGTD